MIVRRIAETDLTRAEDAAINALLEAAFGDDYRGDSFYKQRPHLRLVAERDGRFVGHIALHLRGVRIDGAPVTICGIGEVATHPDHRGRGIASGLLAETLRHARATLADFALLFGEERLYTAAGFRPVSNRMRVVDIFGGETRGVVWQSDGDLMMLALGQRTWDDRAEIDLLGPVF